MTDENVMTMHCRAGHCSFWVDWQGNLVNCGMYALGKNIFKRAFFAEAWKELVAQTEKSMLFLRRVYIVQTEKSVIPALR